MLIDDIDLYETTKAALPLCVADKACPTDVDHEDLDPRPFFAGDLYDNRYHYVNWSKPTPGGSSEFCYDWENPGFSRRCPWRLSHLRDFDGCLDITRDTSIDEAIALFHLQKFKRTTLLFIDRWQSAMCRTDNPLDLPYLLREAFDHLISAKHSPPLTDGAIDWINGDLFRLLEGMIADNTARYHAEQRRPQIQPSKQQIVTPPRNGSDILLSPEIDVDDDVLWEEGGYFADLLNEFRPDTSLTGPNDIVFG